MTDADKIKVIGGIVGELRTHGPTKRKHLLDAFDAIGKVLDAPSDDNERKDRAIRAAVCANAKTAVKVIR